LESLKAYTTRVGSGPFPTELFDADGERLREIGGERGTTTGRPRRCGWFDAPVAKYATRINGLTDIFLTKLDVLSGFEKIPVCVAYEIDGKQTQEIPDTKLNFITQNRFMNTYLDGVKIFLQLGALKSYPRMLKSI
jgi:adenylosuccinate synthase